jgi:nucleoside-diphosphate-sugar epimerase
VIWCLGFGIPHSLLSMFLQEEVEVVGIDCFTDYYPRETKEANIAIADAVNHNNFEFREADLLTMGEYPEVDYVFHEAAQAGVWA